MQSTGSHISLLGASWEGLRASWEGPGGSWEGLGACGESLGARWGGASEPAWKASKLAEGVGADWEGLNVR